MSNEGTPAVGPAKEKGRVLVRGQACQSCYSRKVKCSGEKPTCAKCEKAGRECVYVSLETTRVESMRKKIAEHDARMGDPSDESHSSRRPSNADEGWNGPASTQQISPNHLNPNDQMDISTAQWTGLSPLPQISSDGGYPFGLPMMQQQPLEQHYPLPTLQNPSTQYSQQPPFSTPSIPFGTTNPSFQALPSSSSSHPYPQPFTPHTPAPAPDPRCHTDIYARASTDHTRPHFRGGKEAVASASAAASQGSTPGEEGGQAGLVMVEIPAEVQNHLISLYFERQRLFGVEMHQGRFYSRFYGNHEDTVAPCLLVAMSLMSCKYSPQPHVQQLEEQLYQQAKAKILVLDTTKDGKLLDNIRAALMVAVYEFYRGKVARAFSTYSAAMGLAKAMGLHHISSTKVDSAGRDTKTPYFQRIRLYYGDCPKDNIELGEWIWTFWDVYVVDACVSIGHEYEPTIDDSTVKTPLPRPMTEYEALGSSSTPDQYLPSIFAFDNIATETHDVDAVVRIKAVAALKAAAALRWLDPEPATLHLDAPISPKTYNPIACGIVQTGIEHVERAYLGLRGMRLVGGNTTSDALIVLALGLARIDCCDVRTTGASNDGALGIARNLIAQPHLLQLRHPTDSLIPFFVSIFTRLVYIFAKEIDRLRRINDLETASNVVAEVAVVMNAMNSLGQMNDFSLAVNEAEGVTEGLIEAITNIII